MADELGATIRMFLVADAEKKNICRGAFSLAANMVVPFIIYKGRFTLFGKTHI